MPTGAGLPQATPHHGRCEAPGVSTTAWRTAQPCLEARRKEIICVVAIRHEPVIGQIRCRVTRVPCGGSLRGIHRTSNPKRDPLQPTIDRRPPYRNGFSASAWSRRIWAGSNRSPWRLANASSRSTMLAAPNSLPDLTNGVRSPFRLLTQGYRASQSDTK